MTILRKNFDPGGAGGVVPGLPGSPGNPAYCIDVASTSPSYTLITVPDSQNPGQFVIIPVTGPLVTTITHECFPPIAPTAGTAPIIVPSVSADYYAGWNAAADSIATLPGDGIFQVSAAAGAVGIVVGLAPTPIEPGYFGITHGIYFASGLYQYFEHGVALTPPTAFVSTDVFTIRRIGTQVAYYKGNTLDYTSTQPLGGTVYANASLYFGTDEILSASFGSVSSIFAGIGQRGTFDPAPPVGGGTEVVPPGGVPRYSAAYNTLEGLVRVFASTSATPVILGTGPVPGDPGQPSTPDSNGDWPGRSGGTLRELVVSATSYNGGTIGTGTTPPSSGPDANGDWSGRAGGTLRELVVSAFGSPGDGKQYAIATPSVTNVVVHGEAGLLTPQFAVAENFVPGLGIFGAGVVGSVGSAALTLPRLRVFADNVAGGFLDTNQGTPPTSPSATGDWVGRSGGQLRQLVVTGYAFASSVVFEDSFPGTGTLATNPPTVGGAFTGLDGGSPSGYVLDGSGGLPSAPAGAGEITSTIAPPGPTYTLTETFDPTALGTDAVTLVLAAGTSSGDLVNVTIVWTGTAWTLTATVTSAGGAVLYTGTAPIDFFPGTSDTVSIVVTPTSTSFVVNGTTVLETSAVPGTSPTQVSIQNTTTGATSSITLAEVTMLGAPTQPSYVLATLQSKYSLFSFGHTVTVLDPAGNPTGYGVHATLSAGYALQATGGAEASGTLPRPSLVSSATARLLARVNGTLPSPALTAHATATALASAEARLRSRYQLRAFCGAQARGTLKSPYVVDSSGIVTRFARVSAALPRPTLVAGAAAGWVAQVVGRLPALRAVPSATVVATLGHYQLDARAHTTVTVEYEAYAFTLIEGDDGQLTGTPATHYTTFPFDRIVRFGATHYGVAADGLYELTGDTFAGAPIIAVAQTAEHDFSSPRLKRAVAMYLGGRVAADMEISVLSSELDVDEYTYASAPKDGALNHRVRFGKGIRARYFAFKLTNTVGENFSIDDMSPEMADTRRSLV